MTREDIIAMAREAGVKDWWDSGNDNAEALLECLERFTALVEAHVKAKEKERQRYDIHSCGPDCDRYICVAVRKAREEEREAWPNLEPVINWLENGCNPKDAAAELRLYDAAIRARGQQ